MPGNPDASNANSVYGGWIAACTEYGVRFFNACSNVFTGTTIEDNVAGTVISGVSMEGGGGNSLIGCHLEANHSSNVRIASHYNRVISCTLAALAGHSAIEWVSPYDGPTQGNIIFGNTTLDDTGEVHQEVILSNLGIGTTSPAKKIEVVDNSAAQLRLSHTAGSVYADLQVNTNHTLTIKPTSTGKVILQPTTNSTDFFQVKRQDGTNVVLKINTTQERVGIKTDPGTALDVNGNFAIKDFSFSVNQDQNNCSTNGFSVLRITTNAQRTITGFAENARGEFLWVVNVGSNNLVLANQNAGSDAAFRIITGTGANLTLAADDIAMLWYDSTTTRWRVMSKW